MAKKSRESAMGCFKIILVFAFLSLIGDVVKKYPVISSVIGIVILLGCIIFFIYNYFKNSPPKECKDSSVSIKEDDER